MNQEGEREGGKKAEETVDETTLAKDIGTMRLKYGGEICFHSNFRTATTNQCNFQHIYYPWGFQAL